MSQQIIATDRLMDEALIEKCLSFLNVQTSSAVTYKNNVKAFFEYLYIHGISQPQREHVFEYRNSLIKTGKKPSTVRAYLIALRIFFRWAAHEGIYDDIAAYVRVRNQDYGHRRDALTEHQVHDLLEGIDRRTLRGLRNYAILMVMVIGGLRCVEISRAKIGDFRRRGRSIVLYVHGKGHEDSGVEYVKLPHMARQALRVYLKRRGIVEENAPLFASTGNRGTGSSHLSTREISRIVKNALINAGYNSDRLCAHSLRHTAVTLALKGGEGLEAVKEFARHKSLNTTLIYSHVIDRENCTCSQTIERMIFGGRKKRKKAKTSPAKA